MMEGNYGKYLVVCRQAVADPEVYKDFKNNPGYSYALEHPNYQAQGQSFLEVALSEAKKHGITDIPWPLILCNDAVGNPERFVYKLTDSLTADVSPTTLRYVKTAMLILPHLAASYDGEVDIVEIGGGYGGQAVVLFAMAQLFGVKIASYTIFDLENASKLQQKYISEFREHVPADKFEFRPYGQSSFDVKPNSFVISNYCISEIQEPIRDHYLSTTFKNVTHGFMSWNHALGGTPVSKQLYDNYNVRTTQEVPRTGPNLDVYF